MDNETLLQTVGLKKYFPLRRGIFSRGEQRYVRAVDGVSLSVPRGKTVGVVGESGCGKTTFARTIALLIRPTEGEIHFDGRRIDGGQISRRELYRDMQIVFQDPESSLDPQMKIGSSIEELIKGLMGLNHSEVKKLVNDSLIAVGLSEDFAERIPRQLSGGQKQRVAIARAIATHPKLVILDEPTSALDASVQAQILTLILDLQKAFDLSYLLITHNIAVAKYLSDTIAVMYSGNLVEYGPTVEIIDKPRHPYTVALTKSAPIADPWKRNLLTTEIKGEVPSAINPPSGCRFNPRCPYAGAVCSQVNPPLQNIAGNRLVACHFFDKTASQ